MKRTAWPTGLAVALTLLAAGIPNEVPAHGDADERTHILSHRIEASPNDAGLFLQRGNLYRELGDLDKALADYDHAERLNPALEEIAYHRGRLWLEQGHLDEAIRSLDAFVRKQPQSSAGHGALAEALSLAGDAQGASRAYALAIRYAENPQPDLYLAWANLLLGMQPPDPDQALAVLTRGIEALGPAPALIEAAISAHVSTGRPDRAVLSIDLLSDNLQNTPKWLARRGELLMLAGRQDEAEAAYRQAYEALMALPPHRRRVQAMIELEQEIRSALGQ